MLGRTAANLFWMSRYMERAENIARLIFDHAAAAGLPVVEVVLWETEKCSATYGPGRERLAETGPETVPA